MCWGGGGGGGILLSVFCKGHSLCDDNFLPLGSIQVVSLLSVGSFLQIGCQLLSETRGDVQRKSLDMFTAKIEKGEVKLTVEHVSVWKGWTGTIVSMETACGTVANINAFLPKSG